MILTSAVPQLTGEPNQQSKAKRRERNMIGTLIQSIAVVLLCKLCYRMVRTTLTKAGFDWAQVLRLFYITFTLGAASNGGISMVHISMSYWALLVVVAERPRTKGRNSRS
jgi:hypothetical protein